MSHINQSDLIDTQQHGVQLARDGQYRHACVAHQWVDEHAPEGDLKYANRRDWCDALRRSGAPGDLQKAEELVQSSIVYFSQKEGAGPNWAASMHHLARLHRQQHKMVQARQEIEAAARAMFEYNRPLRMAAKPINPEELYIELDHAAILAITGSQLGAKQAARRALELVEFVGESRAHRRRAQVLYRFARLAKHPWLMPKKIKQAFWGKTS